ncbi:MAG: M28 family peptidase [Terrisporobacter sp.]|uniref:M20/M25/M40 family metallo-hydrolase n=1 Tax=Terrisporobacter sp. TaxID=1965305 RepID=UPI002FC7F3AE
MNNRKISAIILSIVIIISSVIGYMSLYPSKENKDDKNRLNVENQMNYIKNIAKEPHSIFDYEEHENVKNYLIEELKNLGVDSSIYSYDDVYVERSKTKEDLENIYAEIKGKSDSYIMLVTHYDTSRAKRYAERDGSTGAADAGYGLSTILETIKTIKENNIELNNGIKILITDGEEYGLLGAKEAVKEKEIFENVNYLINLEARGTKGPAVMFETSINNSKVIDLYDSSYKPFSYSITPEIYRLLPNGTDFTEFLAKDITGINISVLDGMENYHTPNDSVNSVNKSSLQHYGDQVYPIVKEFVSNEKYADPVALEGSEDSIFFILGNIFIKYSKIINYMLLGVIVVSMIFLNKKLKNKSKVKTLKFTFINLLYIVSIMAISYGVSKVSAYLNGRDFSLTYLPLIKYEKGIFIMCLILATIGYVYMIKKITNNFKEKNEYIVGSILLLFILGIVFTIVLPGGSYLFVFPALLMSMSMVISKLLERYNTSAYIMLIPISLILILYVPTVYLFNCALTFGALCVSMMFAMIAIISVVCCIIAMYKTIK